MLRVGDRVKSIASSMEGTILKLVANHYKFGNIYKVKFDTFFKEDIKITWCTRDQICPVLGFTPNPRPGSIPFHGTGVISNMPLPTPTPEICTHSFRTYLGFTQAFDYCVHCDHKREIKK